MTPKKMQQLVCKALKENKGVDISVIDVRKLTDITDYMIIVSSTSLRHGHALADKVEESLRAQGVRAIGVEGKESDEWVLLDFADVVLHIMRQQAREFYNLEKLWSDGKRVRVSFARDEI